MATEEQLKELAYRLWEEDGRPEGRDQEHYFRARKILEDKEAAPAMQMSPSPARVPVASATSKLSFGRRRK